MDGLDMVQVRQRQLAMPGDAVYSLFADVTASGKIDGLDLVVVRMNQLVMLPDGDPPAAAPAPAPQFVAVHALPMPVSLFGRSPIRDEDAVFG